MAANGLPLPLELTEPALLLGDLESALRGEYDPKTQLCSNTCSRNNTKTANLLGVQVDVSADIQVDDVIA